MARRLYQSTVLEGILEIMLTELRVQYVVLLLGRTRLYSTRVLY
jgi:hypothetical protein